MGEGDIGTDIEGAHAVSAFFVIQAEGAAPELIQRPSIRGSPLFLYVISGFATVADLFPFRLVPLYPLLGLMALGFPLYAYLPVCKFLEYTAPGKQRTYLRRRLFVLGIPRPSACPLS